jgi:hypothetical protein
MTDERGPVFRRARSQQADQRDVYVDKRTPASGVTEFVCDDVTGQHEGEELARIRARRPTPERLRILEQKHDRLDDKVDEIHNDLARQSGQLALLVALAQAREERWKHIAPIVKAIGVAVALVVAAYFGHGMFK